jgi:hypothetical protein
MRGCLPSRIRCVHGNDFNLHVLLRYREEESSDTDSAVYSGAATHVFIDRKPVMEQVRGRAYRTDPCGATDTKLITH